MEFNYWQLNFKNYYFYKKKGRQINQPKKLGSNKPTEKVRFKYRPATFRLYMRIWENLQKSTKINKNQQKITKIYKINENQQKKYKKYKNLQKFTKFKQILKMYKNLQKSTKNYKNL